jgi:outer membrane protein OmpA-like peptidoglycan-associated protein
MLILWACQPVAPTIESASTPSSPGNSVQIVDWWETVAVEHQDRKARLERLASLQGSGPTPRFYEYVIPSEELEGVPVDVPVLRVVFPERVFFDTDRAEIRPEAEQVLDLVAASLKREPPDVALFVAGHTDSRGSEAYNYNLSVERANSHANALLTRGVGQAAIWRVGFGEAIPLASNDTAEGMGFDRRVEFLFAAVPRAAAVWLARQSEDPCFGRIASDAARCKVPLPVQQRQYVALPVTPAAVGPPASSAAVGPPASSAAVGPPALPREEVDIERDQPITIDLDNHRISIQAPRA